ncbi:MAG TPA: hypothetical protein VGX23_30735 [Actinocrinis sp.]|nr:hypothetical protein [Actinocrinis sp.]
MLVSTRKAISVPPLFCAASYEVVAFSWLDVQLPAPPLLLLLSPLPLVALAPDPEAGPVAVAPPDVAPWPDTAVVDVAAPDAGDPAELVPVDDAWHEVNNTPIAQSPVAVAARATFDLVNMLVLAGLVWRRRCCGSSFGVRAGAGLFSLSRPA